MNQCFVLPSINAESSKQISVAQIIKLKINWL